jgi:hypothetical protein
VPAAAAPSGSDVLDHAQQNALRQIEHLTALAALEALGAGQITAAALAVLRRMLELLVGHRDRLQPRPLMPLLATLRPPRRTPQTRFLGSTGGLASPSEDGGRDELREFDDSRARNSASSPSSLAISAACDATSVSSSS